MLYSEAKCHAQVATVVEFETGRLLLRQLRRKTHDFKLLKRSRMPFVQSQLCLADRGYQGFGKLHLGACTPKKPRKQALPDAEKQHNRALASLQCRVEHVIAASRFSASFAGATATDGLVYV